MTDFNLIAEFRPSGGQPEAIQALVKGMERMQSKQILHGVTGSGKTFMVANVIQHVQRPTLVLSHNKTLAAQLCSEYKRFFPHNAVEFFVSYYDYYQPEAYLPGRDIYIEKEVDINEKIDRLRHQATRELMDRRDVIVVASVSCIYGLGNPDEYSSMGQALELGGKCLRESLIRRLVEIQYLRNDIEFIRGRFRVRGPRIDIYPSFGERGVRVDLSENIITGLSEFDPLTGRKIQDRNKLIIYPAQHFVMPRDKIERAVKSIRSELDVRLRELEGQEKILEAARLKQRTLYDLEMIQEVGYCSGIENYSRHFDGREPGEPPFTLLDYFPDDFLLVVDESHATIPQIRAMYGGDSSRKKNLVDHGFRLPSAADNRPLRFGEFEKYMKTTLFTSATPGKYERENGDDTVEVLIRPTGLMDPKITVRPIEFQVDDVMNEIHRRKERKERVLVTTLTKRMAEDLSVYLEENGIRSRYMHSDTKTLDRVKILRELREGKIDVVVGINLLREGLDLPEVSLIAILDADKEGFLRDETTLIQTMGRAARHVSGEAILYADNITNSIRNAITLTNHRRNVQLSYNLEHNISPRGVEKLIGDISDSISEGDEQMVVGEECRENILDPSGEEETIFLLLSLEEEMKEAARKLEFERAAVLRDRLRELKNRSNVQFDSV